MAVWCDHTARVLAEIRAGTWDGHDPSTEPGWTDRVNREAFEASRPMDLDLVRASWAERRRSMLAAFGALDEVTPDADEWFDESGPSHYAEHLPGLEAWVAELRAGA